MVSRDTCFLTLAIVSGFLVLSMDARSWDMAVAIGHEIEFFNRNGTRMGYSKVANVGSLAALAYDSEKRTMYMSDDINDRYSMYSTDLTEPDLDPHPMLDHINGRRISAMVFDPVSRTLFWIDSVLQALMKMEVPSVEDASNGIDSSPMVLHDLKGYSPHGIALDICHRFVYWTNSNNSVHSIERSRLDGTDRKKIFDDKLYEVYALAVDHSGGKLYFADSKSSQYTIEEINLDGTDKRVLVNGTDHLPVYLAVDDGAVYWTDRTSQSVWKVNKNGTGRSQIKSYEVDRPGIRVMSIITRDNVGEIDCEAISKREQNRPKNPPKLEPPVKSSSNLTTSMEDMDSTDHQERDSFNEGREDESTAVRNCTEGSTDFLCGKRTCLNFCVHGECTLDAEGSPQCHCGTNYTGKRCEKDICDGYCLNNGSCSIAATGPICNCGNSRGPRCQYTVEMDKLCALYCLGTENLTYRFSIAICRCSELNQTLPERYTDAESLLSSTILLSALIALIVALVIVVGVLSGYVHKLRRRPRIRKRFVVSKGGVTPLTSRPQLPADSCEITIENCCNMNICETPCFEPKLRATPTKSKKGEEKNSLLDSMEGADSC